MKKLFENFWPWNLNALSRALQENRPINEGLYGVFVFLLLIFAPFIFVEKKEYLIFAGESLLGLVVIYIIHYKQKKENFLRKVICLVLPVALRVSILASICYALILFLNITPELRLSIEFIIDHLLNILGFFYLGYALNKI